MRRFSIVLALVALAATTGAAQPAHLIRFDELPYQAIDGVVLDGVRFSLTGGDAWFGGVGPGRAMGYVDPPLLEGSTASILGLQFLQPTQMLGFGVAMNNNRDTFLRVELFDALSNSLGATRWRLWATTGPFVESYFYWTAAGTFARSATVTFDQSTASRFALDNLMFEDAFVPPTPTPEPTSLALLATGAAGLAGVAVRRQRGRRGRRAG